MTTVNPPRKRAERIPASVRALLREYQLRFPIVNPLDPDDAPTYPPIAQTTATMYQRAVAHEACMLPARLLGYSGAHATEPTIEVSSRHASFVAVAGQENAQVTEAQRPKAPQK